MKKIIITKLSETQSGKSFGKWQLFWRLFLFLILLSLFILLFCLRGCGRDELNDFGPERTIVTPEGDTLRGYNPELMDPSKPRDPGTDSPTEGGYMPDDNRRVDWPIGIGDNREPNLPDDENNRILPVDPDRQVTDPERGKVIDGGHLYVILDSEADDETFNQFSAQLSRLYDRETCSIEYYNTLSKTLLLCVKPEERGNIKTNLPNQITDISFYIVEVEVLSSNLVPNDPAFKMEKTSWHFKPIQAYEAWDITTGCPNVKVAVVDSYFDLYSPDLRHVKIEAPISLERGTNNVLPDPSLVAAGHEDLYCHGTHVAGIIFGQMNNNEGIGGIAPECTFIPVSLGSNLTSVSQIEGILYAVYKGASVINVSIGSYFDNDFVNSITLEQQVEYSHTVGKDIEDVWKYIFKLCEERNITIVWASGNQNILSALDESKRSANTVKVDAVDESLRKASFSNFGMLPSYNVENSTISAPGSNIVSTIPRGDYVAMSGTSMAAPVVTGAIALMKSVNNNLTNAEVIEILKETAKPLRDKNVGGLVQIKDALMMVKDRFMRFDDLKNDHSSIIGTWEASQLLSVVRNSNNTGESIRLSMTFTDENHGEVYYDFVNGPDCGVQCKGPLSVTYSNDEICFVETQSPCGGNRSFIISKYNCKPDGEGYLSVLCEQQGDLDSFSFYLTKK